MTREREKEAFVWKPTRDGYLDFRKQLEGGDPVLEYHALREWRRGINGAKTERARYYDLYLTEKKIEERLKARAEDVARDAQRRIDKIRTDVLRKEVAERVERLAKAWELARKRLRERHSAQHALDVKQGIAERQRRDPFEHRSEAWFEVMHEVQKRHLGELEKLDKRHSVGIDQWIEGARAVEGKAIADAAITRSNEQRARERTKEMGRER